LNDTEYDVWVHHGINWKVLVPVTTGAVAVVGGVATLGVGLVAAAAAGSGAVVGAAAAEAAIAAGGAIILAEEGVFMGVTAATLLGLTASQWAVASTVTGVITGSTAAGLGIALGISEQQAEKIQKLVKDFQEKSQLIKPGEKYTWSGSLSLTKRVYVMNDKLQTDNRGCFTGAAAGSVKEYTISEHFKKLDVKREATT